MAKISKKQVQHIADLAHLEVDREELKQFREELSSILEYISKLEEVDTKDVDPTFQTTDLVNVFAKDTVDESRELSIEDVLSNAPDSEENKVKVKTVL
ncbi:MAG: Asp-tRNA(Asn)/Glu-tRNA(Gln) amidotransferase subunit GatC [Patescibacteria group bacterium]